jgi:2-oxoglutarate ferredoxin oxidoreductase subunit gamma
VRNPYAAIVMNQPSLDRYEPLIIPGGVLINNASLATRSVERTDIIGIDIRANELAEQIASVKLVNVVMIGALINATRLLPITAVQQALAEHMLKGKPDLLKPNLAALECIPAMPAASALWN